jgi:ankyrin repeat protein
MNALQERLLALGAHPNAVADVDADGLNGQTPLFHTVNSNANRSAPIMRLLLKAGARADARLQGITWGLGLAWETICYDVTPLSYAQLGLPRMQRTEADVYANIAELLAAQRRPAPRLGNVPNRYLRSFSPNWLLIHALASAAVPKTRYGAVMKA